MLQLLPEDHSQEESQKILLLMEQMAAKYQKNFLRSIEVKNIKISKTRKPQITHVETKLVVSTTLDKKPRDLSVEH